MTGADSASNISSTGIISTFVTEQQTRPNQAAGNLFRWTNINPGADGTITITFDPLGGTNLGYLNSMYLATVPEPSSALLGGLGFFALLRRRS